MSDETTIDDTGLDQLAAALAACQAELPPAGESGLNPHLRNRYATLADVWAACRGPLTKHGLSVVQCPMPDEEGWCSLQTFLLHTSGQRLSSITRIPVSKPDAQAYGAALSYARRYALAAMVGIVSGSEDDDGEGAVSRQPAREQPLREAGQAPDSAGDRVAAGGLPVHTGEAPCSGCRAPAGKPHTRACPVAAGK